LQHDADLVPLDNDQDDFPDPQTMDCDQEKKIFTITLVRPNAST